VWFSGTFERDRDAAVAYAEAVTLARQQYGDAHVEVAFTVERIVRHYRRLGRLQDAKRLRLEVLRYRRSGPARGALAPLGAPETISVRHNTRWASTSLRCKAFKAGIANSRSAQGDDDPTLGQDFTNVGMIYGAPGAVRINAFENLSEALRRGETYSRCAQRDDGELSRQPRAQRGALSGDLASAEPLMRQAVADLVAPAIARDACSFLACTSKASRRCGWMIAAASLALVERAIDIGSRLGGDLPESDSLSLQVEPRRRAGRNSSAAPKRRSCSSPRCVDSKRSTPSSRPRRRQRSSWG
jgi:hypothetical protein